MANGMFFSNSACTSSSSSGKMNTLVQSAGSHSSSGTDSAAVSHVAISGVKASVSYSLCACSVVSPLVV